MAFASEVRVMGTPRYHPSWAKTRALTNLNQTNMCNGGVVGDAGAATWRCVTLCGGTRTDARTRMRPITANKYNAWSVRYARVMVSICPVSWHARARTHALTHSRTHALARTHVNPPVVAHTKRACARDLLLQGFKCAHYVKVGICCAFVSKCTWS